jgi:RNA polymerase sigma factor (sigma-70 family)
MAVSLVRFMRRLASPRGASHDPDAELLERFAASGDQSAFAALLKRHGPMVFGVCRRVLNDRDDADDAFQATFLVLARKAGSVRRSASLASWLYGVAHRTALKARASAAQRRAIEREAIPTRTAVPDPALEALWRDLRPLLDEEVARLPEKNRAAFVLCYLEGRTTEEAAQSLNCPRGTVLSRLAWARERLRARLTRRGLALSGGVLASLLAPAQVSAAVPPALLTATAQAPAGVLSAQVLTLSEGVLRAMWLTKLKAFASVLAAVAVLGAAGLFTYETLSAQERGGEGKSDRDRLQGTWAFVSQEIGGKQILPRDQEKDDSLTFKGDRAILIHSGQPREAGYTLDPKRSPKEIDLIIETNGKTEIHKGIYMLEGNTLKLCIAHPPLARPSEFASKEGERWPVLVVFRKK